MSKELRWLVRQAWPLRHLYALRLASVVLVSLLALVDPLILKWLIDQVITWKQTDMLPLVSLAFFTLFFFRFTFAAMNRLLDVYTAERVIFDVRRRLLGHLQRLSGAFYLGRSRGELLHRVESDVEQLGGIGGQTLASLLRILVMTFLSAVVMVLLDWRLALLVLPLLPIMVLLRYYGQERLRRASERVQTAVGERYGFVENQLAHMMQVQLLNRQAGERRRFGRLGREVLESRFDRRLDELLLSFSYQVTVTLAGAAVLGFGGYRVLHGNLTIGGLVAFYSYLLRIFEPMEVMVHLYSELMRATASIRRVMEIMDHRPRILDPASPEPWPQGIPEVGFKKVAFSYDEVPVLNDFSLRIRPGERVALVGASGSGKSTVGRLLSRQYGVTCGSITIGGVPVESLTLRDLRRSIAIVTQEPVLFDVSLRENLRYANPQADDRELLQALATAQVAEVVGQLEAGFDTTMGSRGDRLSGGQRQRVAIARAILQQAPLLILDEATSALDGFTEHRLLQALDESLGDRTAIVIAHRPSAIVWADRVVMMEGGRVLDHGAPAELYNRCAAYRRLMDEQATADNQADGAQHSANTNKNAPQMASA